MNIKFNKIAALAGLALALLFGTHAHAQGLSYYYSHPLTASNLVINGNSVLTNLTIQNYDPSGPYSSTKGTTVNDPNATFYTFQLVSAQVIQGTNLPQYATNVTAVFAPILDDFSVTSHFPYAASNTFSVTFTASPTTGWFTSLATVPATNTFGAKQFKCVSLIYSGTNQLSIPSFRDGFWY